MQIHELNTFGGDLDNTTYAVVDNGTDTGKVSIPDILQSVTEDIEAVDARIDNIISSPAPSEAEIIDARLGEDGITYTSLGQAIRTQVRDLTNDIALANDGRESVRLLSPFVRGALWDGEIQSYGNYRVANTNLIDFPNQTVVSIASGYKLAVNYFVNGVWQNQVAWVQAGTYTIPAGSSVRFGIATDPEDTSTPADIGLFTNAVTVLSSFGNYMTMIDSAVKSKGGITSSNYSTLGFSSVVDLPYNSIWGIGLDITSAMITDLPVYGIYGQIKKTVGIAPNIYILYEYTSENRDRYIAWQNTASSPLSAWTRIATGAGDGLTPVSARTLISSSSKVIFIGDSIVAGVGGTGWQQDSGRLLLNYGGVDLYANDNGVCWANMMRDYLVNNYGCTAFNNGLSGFNSVNIPQNIASLVPSDATHVIACWGINDRAYNYDTIGGYQTVIDYCNSIGAEIVPVTICPCNQPNSIYSHTQYEILTRIKTVCKNNNLEVCDLFSAVHDYFYITGKTFDTDYLPDKLHPNDAMYTIIYHLMRKLLGV